MAEVRASVAICTLNRARALTRLLESLCSMRVPAGTTWEVVIVDNGSTDRTANVIAQYAHRLPLREFLEPECGLSRARNRVIAEARGEYIFWIDDDAVVDAEWLAAYLDALHEWSDASLLGGPIDVAFDGQLPDWFTRVLPRIADVFGYRNLGALPRRLETREEELPFGANFVTRALDQRKFPFDPMLGRHPSHPGRGSEESAVLMAMLESGMSGRWVPGARVTHMPDAARASTAFIGAHLEAYGAYRATRFPPPGTLIAGAPIAVWWEAATTSARYVVQRCLAPPERWIETLVQRSLVVGMLKGLRAR